MAATRKNKVFHPRNWIGLSDGELTHVQFVVDLAIQNFWNDNDNTDEGDRNAFNDLLAVQEALNSLARE